MGRENESLRKIKTYEKISGFSQDELALFLPGPHLTTKNIGCNNKQAYEDSEI